MLPTDPKERKATPIYSGVVKYFPLALAEIARVSKAGNDQHNPGQPLHWDKSKSTDHLDCIMRHIADAGTMDSDGQRHTAKVAWRALAALEIELESITPEVVYEPNGLFDPRDYSLHTLDGYLCSEASCGHHVERQGSLCYCHV